jgi:hypothetical protein
LPGELLRRVDALVAATEDDPANAFWRVSRGALLRRALIEGLAILEERSNVRPTVRRVRRTTRRGGGE